MGREEKKKKRSVKVRGLYKFVLFLFGYFILSFFKCFIGVCYSLKMFVPQRQCGKALSSSMFSFILSPFPPSSSCLSSPSSS